VVEPLSEEASPAVFSVVELLPEGTRGTDPFSVADSFPEQALRGSRSIMDAAQMI
jgi:hypothetical protein